MSRASFVPVLSWQEAVADFLLLAKGTREESTECFYRERLKLLVRWTDERGVPLIEFRSREEYIEGDPLSDFQVPRAARAYVKCPSDEEIRTLLRSLQERWKPSLNPGARFVHASVRLFFSRRNYAIIAGLIETGARIGELLSPALDDYQPGQAQIVIRRTKGDEPRTLPISTGWMEVVDRLEEWIHTYLNAPCWTNAEVSRAIKQHKERGGGFWIGPVQIDLSKLIRGAGPEAGIEFYEPAERWERRIERLIQSLQDPFVLPPLRASCSVEKLSLRF